MTRGTKAKGTTLLASLSQPKPAEEVHGTWLERYFPVILSLFDQKSDSELLRTLKNDYGVIIGYEVSFQRLSSSDASSCDHIVWNHTIS
jgi:hypothetical protein